MRERLESLLLVLAVGALVAIGAKRVSIPYNVALVVVGLLLVLMDALPNTPMNPEIGARRLGTGTGVGSAAAGGVGERSLLASSCSTRSASDDASARLRSSTVSPSRVSVRAWTWPPRSRSRTST